MTTALVPYGADQAAVRDIARRPAVRLQLVASAIDRLQAALRPVWERLVDTVTNALRAFREALGSYFGWFARPGDLVRHRQSGKVGEVVARDGGVLIVQRLDRRHRWPAHLTTIHRHTPGDDTL